MIMRDANKRIYFRTHCNLPLTKTSGKMASLAHADETNALKLDFTTKQKKRCLFMFAKPYRLASLTLVIDLICYIVRVTFLPTFL